MRRSERLEVLPTPWSTWPDVSKVAFEAAEMAYAYDLSLYSSPEAAEANAKYRTNELRRHDFPSALGTMFYRSAWSTDQCAVFTCRNMIMLAFRGTDFDPNRYLGFVPDDYDENLMRQLRIWGDSASLTVEEGLNKLPFSLIERCKCTMTKCDEKTFKSRENAIGKVSDLYCHIDPSTSIREETSNLILRGGLGRCSSFSDCAADLRIAHFGLPGNKWATELMNDPKHVQAMHTAIDALRRFKETFENPVVVCTGHSLGGGLGLYTHLELNLRDQVQWEHSYFIGFNSALLGNYYKMANRLSAKNALWPTHAVSYRDKYDIVSRGALESDKGSVQVIDYKRPKSPGAWLLNLSDTLTHGLWIFKSCGMKAESETTFGNDFHRVFRGKGKSLKLVTRAVTAPASREMSYGRTVDGTISRPRTVSGRSVGRTVSGRSVSGRDTGRTVSRGRTVSGPHYTDASLDF